MAKARGGLGRGLGSLLGGPLEGSMAPSPAPSVTQTPSTNDEEEVVEEPPEEVVEEDLNLTPEENVTIKRVVERKAPSAPSAKKSEEEAEAKADFEVDVNLIIPNPDQPRTNFKKDELEELAESIKRNGLLSPIVVRRVDDKYQIVAGERRWQACKKAGMAKIPIRIIEADDDQAIILALIENIQRSDLNPIEEAYGYRRMMERGKMTQSEVAQAVSKGRTTITNALRLLELPEEAQQLLYEERITAGHARAILSIPTKEGRQKLTEKLVNEQLSVREAENIARLISGKPKREVESRVALPKTYKTVARALSDTLETAVKIKSVKGGNKIEISFKDEAELQRLFRVITKS